jgi:hypothetical protein
MKKEELREELDQLEVEWSSRETVAELRERLRSARRDLTDSDEMSEQEKKPALTVMNKFSLQELMKAKGMTVTANMTRDTMISILTKQYFLEETPCGTDKLEIGKHRGSTYRTIRDTDPGFVEWAKSAVKDDGSSVDLKRFVKWITLTELEPDKYLREQPTGKTEPAAKKESGTGSQKSKKVLEESFVSIRTEEWDKHKKEMEELKKQILMSTRGDKRGSSSISSDRKMDVDKEPAISPSQIEHVMTLMFNKIQELEARLTPVPSENASSGSWVHTESPQ